MLPGALAARLGGDEFCLLAVGPSADDVVKVADELCSGPGSWTWVRGWRSGSPRRGPDRARCARPRRFRLADAAQYRAKAARRQARVAGRAGAR